VVANTLNSFRDGASLLAKASELGFISWLDGLAMMLSNLPLPELFRQIPSDEECGRTRHGDFLIANDLSFATSVFKAA